MLWGQLPHNKTLSKGAEVTLIHKRCYLELISWEIFFKFIFHVFS